MPGHRLLIVSNRLPVTAALGDDGRVRLGPASGGLATGMRPWHEGSGGLWIGWPGDTSRFSTEQRAEMERQLGARGIVPVLLSEDHVNRYYHGFANRVLWPLFHYLIDRVPVDATGWDAYRQVNQTFADAIIRQYAPGDIVWVHDYQLMLLPSMLRARIPDARVGFFLHIPFPSSEIFRTLPWRREVLDGLLGADLVGFHTFAYLRHFVASLLHVEGVEADIDRVRVGDREVRLGAFPMGIDAVSFATHAQDPEVIAEAAAIRHDAGGRKILLGVDRLDYTKGIPRRLQAVERLLTREPALRDEVRYIQVAVPSRGEVDSYQRFRRLVEETVGRINGTCGTLRSTPVHYMHQSVSIRELVALYLAADVMLVTPLRDGMNLVAKEFLASRVDEDGVLVLSEFAGAAAELGEAIVVNPYDVDAVAEAMRRALSMPLEERRARMRPMRRRVLEYDVHAWAGAFMAQLQPEEPAPRGPAVARAQPSLSAAIAEAVRSGSVRLLLDYDGTLVPLAGSPELAAPDADLLELLAALAASPGVGVELVSGRPRETLEAWFGPLPLTLWAEHGFWRRHPAATAWEPEAAVVPGWFERIYPILEQFTASTPGSRIETKSASVAWHYRGAHRDFGARQAHELRMLLGDALSNQPLEVLEGKKVIEVRLRGISKAVVAHRMDPSGNAPAAVIAFGDDRTDEDLFHALPASSITVGVGQRLSGARYQVDDYRAVRQILRGLVVTPSLDPPHAAGGRSFDQADGRGGFL
ncbi:MAG TPA: bifunctional alpha,alpha-trehalose-phosphate synthase (UDP-forming)/trehalose-phosphatase [Vicinamibacterales bacterium]|nr:bifunctional alpha,alpha-trehalose-phosphate synthase (UDP-forming)/trehalose-phosphatase [Vicinamibacterales bacterium]